MISSSNFFEKTFFKQEEQQTSNNKQLGPWIKQDYSTITPKIQNPQIFLRHRNRSVRLRKEHQEYYLPVINANVKMLEMGALSSIKSTNSSTKQRRYVSIDGQKTQTSVRKTIDMRLKKLTELKKSLHKRSISPADLGVTKTKKFHGGLFKIVGIPTSNLFL